MTTEVEKVSDNFDSYSDGNLETVSSSTWVDLRPSDAGHLAVASLKVTFAAGAFAAARHTGGSGWTSEVWAEVVLSDIAGGGGAQKAGVILYATSDVDAACDFYMVYSDTSSALTRVVKFANGSTSVVDDGGVNDSWVNGDTLKAYCETSGANRVISIFKNGTFLRSYTDSSSPLSAGSSERVGVMARNDAKIDSFRGGILTADGGGGDILMGQAVF